MQVKYKTIKIVATAHKCSLDTNRIVSRNELVVNVDG